MHKEEFLRANSVHSRCRCVASDFIKQIFPSKLDCTWREQYWRAVYSDGVLIANSKQAVLCIFALHTQMNTHTHTYKHTIYQQGGLSYTIHHRFKLNIC